MAIVTETETIAVIYNFGICMNRAFSQWSNRDVV